MTTMKAIVQVRYGSPDGLELREIDEPTIDDDGVLVSVRAASVNAADWHMLRRLPHLIGKAMRMPSSRVAGRDLAGVVEAVGKHVTGFAPGDEVFGVGLGSYAETTWSTADRLAPKPRNLTFEQAAALPIAGCTALQGLRDVGRIQPGQRVVVHGAGGGVGSLAVSIAKALGAHVTAVTRTDNLELVRSLGAHEVVDYTRSDFTRRGQCYDVLFDVGADRSLADCSRVLVPHGRHVMAGAARGGTLAIVSRMLRARLPAPDGIQRRSFLARVRYDDLVALQGLAEDGKLVPAIDRRFPLSEVAAALRYLGTGRARGKVVVQVS
jgi:NADPH:quinone reductase-like Zn-dependent oxidoreductase